MKTFAPNFQVLCLVAIILRWAAAFELSNYDGLISEAHAHFKTSSVVLLHHDFNGMKELRELRDSVRSLSAKGILAVSMDFENLDERISTHKPRIAQSLCVVIVRSALQVALFSQVTGYTKMDHPIWLLVVNGDLDLRSLTKMGNASLFHLSIDTQMFVFLTNSNRIEEWYAIRNERRSAEYATWNLETGLALRSHKSLYQRRSNLEKSPIVVTVINNPPLVTYENSMIGGYFGEIILELVSILNFDMQIKVPKDPSYGIWNHTSGEWTGMIGMLTRGQADIVATVVKMTKSRMAAVDFTHPVMHTSSKLYIRQPEGAIRWSGYVRIFAPKIWIAVAISVLSTSCLLTIAAAVRGGDEATRSSFAESFIVVLGIYCQQGATENPTSLSLRIAYLSTFVTALLVSAAFSASLISFLAATDDRLPFSTLEGFVEDGSYKLIVFRGGADYEMLKFSKETVTKKLLSMLKPDAELPRSKIEGFHQVCNEKVAYLMQEVLRDMLRMDLPCDMVTIDAKFDVSFSAALSKRNPYVGIIDYYIQQFRANGIYDRWKRLYAPVINPKTTSTVTVVTVEDIAPLLIILSAGLGLAVVVLVLEIICNSKCVSAVARNKLSHVFRTKSKYIGRKTRRNAEKNQSSRENRCFSSQHNSPVNRHGLQ